MSLCQAVFSQTEGLEGDGSTEAQYAYYPATIAEATSGTMVTTVQASDTLLGQTTPTGKRRPRLHPETESPLTETERFDLKVHQNVFMSHRAGLCDDVTPGSFNGLQSEDDRPPHPALHSVIIHLR